MKTSLEKEFKDFYNSNEDYYIYSRKLNEPLGEERLEAFRFILNGSLVLDVGCGSAENGKHISKFARYIGIDFSKKAMDVAREYESEGFRLIRGDVARLCFKPNSFDVVTATYSLEHFLRPLDVLNEIYLVCKKDGKIILISPSWEFPFEFPPSINFGLNIPKRVFHILARICDDFIEALFSIRKDFRIIKKPSFLRKGYSQDNDTVYMTKSREVIRFFKDRGCSIVYLPLHRDFSGNFIMNLIKHVLIKLPIYRFGASRLFVVFKK